MNKKVNKVIVNNEVVIDLSLDTVIESDVARGKSFHKADGTQATGTYNKPYGELKIYENGNYDVLAYDKVQVAIPEYDGTIYILISFKINSTTYFAEEGMTWGEWCDSNYNTGGYADNGTYIAPNGYLLQYVSLNQKGITKTDLIITNATYDVVSGGSGD